MKPIKWVNILILAVCVGILGLIIYDRLRHHEWPFGKVSQHHTVVRHYWATKFEPDSAGNWLIVQERRIPLGQRRCFYLVGFDSAGQVVTGVPYSVDSTTQNVYDPRLDGRFCPDTMVDPRFLPYPTPHPPPLPPALTRKVL